MALSPQKFREIVFQLVYSEDFGGDAEVVEMLMAQLAVTKRIVREASDVKDKIIEKKKELEEVIRAHSEGYDYSRIPGVERNVIRLGVYELLYSKDVPPKVVIAEAIRLTRKFATPEASSFVNAILDSVYKQTASENTDVPTLSGLTV
jgi:transcription antitermination protein NusB